jgi:3-hydroxyisobutyrate dehydrogenase-like beta-hydroxyacid dehydrogenase
MTDERVAIIGTGAIGSAVARRLLGAGRRVVVWNRTVERTDDLVRAGATRAPTGQEAAVGGGLVVLALTDYGAVRQSLPADLTNNTVAVLCTGTAADAAETAALVAERGGRYLDAGVQVSPEAIGDGTGSILYSGDRAAFDEHRDVFALLGPPRFVGESPGAAAVWDMTLFGLWYDAQLGLLRALKTAQDAGIDLDEFGEIASTQLGYVISGREATVDEMKNRRYPRGPATLIEHLTVLKQLKRDDDVIRTIENLIAANRGHEGLTAITSEPRQRAGREQQASRSPRTPEGRVTGPPGTTQT